MKKEIIVAIDGSVYSNQALTYIATLFYGRDDIVFHLTTWMTAGTSIMPSSESPNNSLIPEVSSSTQKETSARRDLKKAVEKLVRLGIDESRITTTLKTSGYNIAVGIQQCAKEKMVDAVLVGRRGLTALEEMLMGSVSANLFKKCHSVPLWIIDGEVQSKDFLVPVDGSPHSLLAVDHLAHILAGRSDIRISLFHCTALFGKKVTCHPKLFYENWDRKWCDTYLSGTDCLFEGPRQLLEEAGIAANKIIILPEASNLEESRGIIRQAKAQNCGTIVMGRHGVGIAKGLFGGVSDRTIKQVQNLALWIVG